MCLKTGYKDFISQTHLVGLKNKQLEIRRKGDYGCIYKADIIEVSCRKLVHSA
jgi:hypothetical protein